MIQGWQRLLFFSKNNGDKFGAEKPEKDLMDLLVEKTISAGHMLSFQEASSDPEMVQPNNYAFYFGSFSDAAKIAWLKARPSINGQIGSVEPTLKTATMSGKTHQHTEIPRRKEVIWMSESKEEKQKGKGARYTVEEIKSILVDFYSRTKRLPSQKDAQEYSSGLPSWGTLIKFLGPKSGWQAIIDSGQPIVGSEIPSVTTEEETDLQSDGEAAVTNDFSETTEPVDNAEPIESDSGMPAAAVHTPSYDDIEEVSEGSGRDTRTKEETPQDSSPQYAMAEDSVQEDDIKVETTSKEHDSLVTLELKIILPDREKPIFIALTV